MKTAKVSKDRALMTLTRGLRSAKSPMNIHVYDIIWFSMHAADIVFFVGGSHVSRQQWPIQKRAIRRFRTRLFSAVRNYGCRVCFFRFPIVIVRFRFVCDLFVCKVNICVIWMCTFVSRIVSLLQSVDRKRNRADWSSSDYKQSCLESAQFAISE